MAATNRRSRSRTNQEKREARSSSSHRRMEPIHYNAQRKISVDGRSDYGGNVVETSGIDLSKGNPVDAFNGDIAVGSKLFIHTTEGDDANLSTASQFAYSDCDSIGTLGNPQVFKWFAAVENRVLRTADLASHFALDNGIGNPTDTLSGDMTVFGKSLAFEGATGGTGTLSTAGTEPSTVINCTSDMSVVKRDAKVTVSPAPPIAGTGRLYTDVNGGSTTIHIADGDFSKFLVGTIIVGHSANSNPTTDFTGTITAKIDSTTVVISVSVDLPYGVTNWTYQSAGLNNFFYAHSDGSATGITSYDGIDLHLGGYTFTYENPSDFVDQLLVGTSKDIWMKTKGAWTANWWTITLSQLPFKAPPKFVHLPSLGRLYIIDDIDIHYIQQEFNYVVPFVFRNQIAQGDECKWVVNDDFNIYIGVENPTTGVAGVWLYQPLAGTEKDKGDIKFYDMNASHKGCGTGWVWKNVLYILHPDGSIKAFNGNGFDTVAFTPGYKKNVPFVIFRHGVATDGKTFWFLTAGSPNAYDAGLWKCDTDSWNFYLHSQPVTRPAIAGELPQFGEKTLASAGGLFFDGTDFLAGIKAKDGLTQGTTNYHEILCSSNRFSVPYGKGGWFLTPKVVFDAIKVALAKLWTKYVLYAGESIDIRYRSAAYAKGTPGGRDEDFVTWGTYVPPVGPAQYGILFTTTVDISEVAIGDEVTISRGANAGLSAFVVTKQLNVTTYTVLLDKAVGLTTSINSYVTWRKFNKVKTLDKTTLQSEDTNVPFGSNPSEWVQFKYQMNGDTSSVKDLRLTVQDQVK